MDVEQELRQVADVLDGYVEKHRREGHVDKAARNEALAATVRRAALAFEQRKDEDDDTINAIVYALEDMRDSKVWRGPMRIDGSTKEFAEDVRAFVKAADDMEEGRNVVSLGTYQAATDELVDLRAQVAEALKFEPNWKTHTAQIDAIERLTKERDELQQALIKERNASCIYGMKARAENARHLETIRALRAERDSVAAAAHRLVEALRRRHHGRMPDDVLRAFDGVRTAIGKLPSNVIPALLDASREYEQTDDVKVSPDCPREKACATVGFHAADECKEPTVEPRDDVTPQMRVTLHQPASLVFKAVVAAARHVLNCRMNLEDADLDAEAWAAATEVLDDVEERSQ